VSFGDSNDPNWLPEDSDDPNTPVARPVIIGGSGGQGPAEMPGAG
jgi:hypothetical protein